MTDPDHPGYDQSRTVWGQLGERFGLVALRPKLSPDVRVRKVGDETELFQTSTGVTLELAPDEAGIVRHFDGGSTIAEIIAAESRANQPLAVRSVLELVDRVMRAQMLESFPPNMFRQLERHLAVRALQVADRYAPLPGDVEDSPAPDTAPAAAEGDAEEIVYAEGGARPSGPRRLPMTEQVPWRPRTPLLEERARFLREVELLRNLDSWAIGTLAEEAHEETFPASSNIVTEGQRADRFYIVRTGDVNVTRVDEDDDDHTTAPRRIAKLGPGDWFGEVGLLEGAARNANVRVGPSRPAQLYSFTADIFERFIAPHIASYRGRQGLVRRRDRLAQLTLFSELDRDDLERLALTIKEHHVPASTVIFQQGEVGDRFYLVMEGAVGVVRDGVPVAKLTVGDFFGETALLFNADRNATVISIDDAVLWSIDKAAFGNMLQHHLLRRRDIMPTVLNRLHG